MYLAGLLFSLFGLSVLDYKYRLAWFSDAQRTAKTLLVSIVLFIVWDLAGIGLHIFFIGSSNALTGVRLWYEFPVEELFFLTLFCYTALLLWRMTELKWPRT